MEIFGVDHPGIIHEISHALARQNVSIDELATETWSAPMGGGTVFEAQASLRIPPGLSLPQLRDSLTRLADELAVDIKLMEHPGETH